MMSENMYHRVYQLVKRNVDLHVIAATLDLPLRTVLNVIARIEKSGLAGKTGSDDNEVPSDTPQQHVFLDSYFVTKNRYAIVQFVGFVVREMMEKLERELQAAKLSLWKTMAVQLTDVTDMDETGARKLLDFCNEMKSRDRYVALLDPSKTIEPALSLYKLEGTVHIFGTLWAFEAEALSNKRSPAGFNRKSRGPNQK
jgi:ABC-type transporter Mla MlaB component